MTLRSKMVQELVVSVAGSRTQDQCDLIALIRGHLRREHATGCAINLYENLLGILDDIEGDAKNDKPHTKD